MALAPNGRRGECRGSRLFPPPLTPRRRLPTVRLLLLAPCKDSLALLRIPYFGATAMANSFGRPQGSWTYRLSLPAKSRLDMGHLLQFKPTRYISLPSTRFEFEAAKTALTN